MTRRPSVLIADDYAPAASMVRTLLQDDYEIVAIVGDGLAALEASARHRPDVVLLDISMPLMNGLVASAELKRTSPDIKVIFVTQQSAPAYVDAAFRSGADGYVCKGGLASELPSALDVVLAGQRYLSPRIAGVQAYA